MNSLRIDKAAVEAEKLQTIGKERLVQALKNAEGTLQEQQIVKSSFAENQSISMRDSQSVEGSEAVKNINIEVSKNPNINDSIKLVREQLVESQKLPKELSEKVNRTNSSGFVSKTRKSHSWKSLVEPSTN